MADMMEYKCPACGGAMEFDSGTQKMKCPYCDTVMEIETFQKLQKEEAEKTSENEESGIWEAAGNGEWQEGETKGMRVYSCQSCGGEIVADENTGATTCPFCGNRVVIKGQFSGSLRPDSIIPFKLDKRAAKEAYHLHLKGKPFLPAVFKEENHIDEIKGVYVPFWIFDAEAKADASYHAERHRIWRTGNTEYTEHEIYNVRRNGSIQFQHVPADGSKKMDDALMESIEPYDFTEAVPFQSAYLAGYVADRYDVDVDECIRHAKRRMKASAVDAITNTVQGYHAVRIMKSSAKVTKASYQYMLCPVWLLNTQWNGKKYIFAMNGQTGKMVGNLPLDKKAFHKYVITRGTLIGIVIYAIMWALFMI